MDLEECLPKDNARLPLGRKRSSASGFDPDTHAGSAKKGEFFNG
jgi:hypothetical protein